MDNKKIVEIAGVKIEIDQAGARKIESYRVGDSVKLLVKLYGDSFKVYPGVIAGFDDFKSYPTITVAYIDTGYNDNPIKFTSITPQSKDVEICPLQGYEFPHEKTTVIDKFDRVIEAKEAELLDLKAKRRFFLDHFGKYFEAQKTKEA